MRSSIPFVAMTALLFNFLFFSITHGFHESGARHCQGCHSFGGSRGEPHRSNIRGSDPSSTCLRCHAASGESHNVMSNDGSSFTPGGDFYWLKKTFGWSAQGIYQQSEAARHGHNISAIDYGLSSGSGLPNSPGGSYMTANLSCISCHDQHARTRNNGADMGRTLEPGRYNGSSSSRTSIGNYRLLRGKGDGGSRNVSGFTFTYEAPIAVGSSLDWTETDFNHSAYGSGMSEWCANCHAGFLSDHVLWEGKEHPAGKVVKINGEIAGNYNAYVKAGDLSGAQVSAYLSLVPFEVGTSDTSYLDPSSTLGPDPGGSANVMCLTCHRAHASAFESIGRWDFKTVFIADSHPQAGDSGVTGSDVQSSYYGRDMVTEFGNSQRQLCNKCHLKD